MLKIKHPGAIVREREKKLNTWEVVHLYKYANGVECQLLIGHLPHGNLQSVVSANRALTLHKDGSDLHISFGDEPAPLVDFAAGDRPSAQSASVAVLDPCRFVPRAKVAVAHDGAAGETAQEGANSVTTFGDGTRLVLEPHGGHAHVEATQGDAPVQTFFNGKDNTLYVFGPAAF